MKDQRSKIKDQNKSKGKSSEIQTNLIIKGSRILIFGLGSWSLFCALILGLWISCPSLAYAQSTIYPKFDISGYKKWEYKRVDVDPSSNYFSGLTQLGGFYQTYSGGPWQERLKLKIIGELSQDLSVTYNINIQPETHDQFDVQVKSILVFFNILDFPGNNIFVFHKVCCPLRQKRMCAFHSPNFISRIYKIYC